MWYAQCWGPPNVRGHFCNSIERTTCQVEKDLKPQCLSVCTIMPQKVIEKFSMNNKNVSW